MTELSGLTLLLLQYGFLLVLWLFVFAVIFSLRADVFGVKVRKLPVEASASPPVARQAVSPDAPTELNQRIPQPVAPQATGAATATSTGHLVITSGQMAGLEIPLGRKPLTIGRSSESGLVIRDDYTSSHHARLVLWGEQWMLQDLESTNGTFIDGRRVQPNDPVAVRLGVPMKVGATTFELRK